MDIPRANRAIRLGAIVGFAVSGIAILLVAVGVSSGASPALWNDPLESGRRRLLHRLMSAGDAPLTSSGRSADFLLCLDEDQLPA